MKHTLLALSILSLTACGGGSDSSNEPTYPIANPTLSDIAGVWNFSIDMGVQGTDEYVADVSSGGVMRVYDWLGDTFDNGNSCYVRDTETSQFQQHSDGNIYINNVSNDGQFTFHIDSIYDFEMHDENTVENKLQRVELHDSDETVEIDISYTYDDTPTAEYRLATGNIVSTATFEFTFNTWSIQELNFDGRHGLNLTDTINSLVIPNSEIWTRYDGTISDVQPLCTGLSKDINTSSTILSAANKAARTAEL